MQNSNNCVQILYIVCVSVIFIPWMPAEGPSPAICITFPQRLPGALTHLSHDILVSVQGDPRWGGGQAGEWSGRALRKGTKSALDRSVRTLFFAIYEKLLRIKNMKKFGETSVVIRKECTIHTHAHTHTLILVWILNVCLFTSFLTGQILREEH